MRLISWIVRMGSDRGDRHTRRWRRYAVTQTGYQVVYDADLKGYFDSIPHSQLLACVRMRVVDRSVLKLIRMWLEAPVVERSEEQGGGSKWSRPKKGTPQGGVASPLLANLYLHWFDALFYGPHGPARRADVQLVRYADDFVVMCDTKAQVEEARRRVGMVLARLGLELHPEKTRLVDLSRGREGFDFLGCHLRKRMSGPIWERTHRRVFFLHRGPSQRAMARVRARVRELTPRGRCHEDLRTVIADVNRLLRGWANYFRTGNATVKFIQIDTYVEERLRGLRYKRAGSRLRAGRADVWTRPFFESLGLCRLRGTIVYPGAA